MSNTKRVLFVDDDASLGKMFVDLLSGAGYDARICETGAAALQQVSLFHPHLVLLDIGAGHFRIGGFAQNQECPIDS
jgi:DNA-binding response OmpR family regulator